MPTKRSNVIVDVIKAIEDGRFNIRLSVKQMKDRDI